MSDSEDLVDLNEEGGDDLFGDDSPSGSPAPDSPAPEVLSDRDLDSDVDQANEVGGYESNQDADEPGHQEKVVAGIQIYRHRTPRTKEGRVSRRRNPRDGWFPNGTLIIDRD